MIAIMSETWIPAFADAPERPLPAGAALFRRGDPVRHLFLLRAGEVALTRALADGGALTLHVAGPGAVVAPASLWAASTHCDALCRTEVRVAVRPVAALRDWLGASPAAAALAEAARELQALRARVEVLRLRRLADRLDAYLDLYGPPGPGGWVQVADWIGVTPPALYRELARRDRRAPRITARLDPSPHGIPKMTASRAALPLFRDPERPHIPDRRPARFRGPASPHERNDE